MVCGHVIVVTTGNQCESAAQENLQAKQCVYIILSWPFFKLCCFFCPFLLKHWNKLVRDPGIAVLLNGCPRSLMLTLHSSIMCNWLLMRGSWRCFSWYSYVVCELVYYAHDIWCSIRCNVLTDCWLVHVAARRCTLQRVGARCSVSDCRCTLQHVGARCSVLVHVAACRCTLQRVGACCSVSVHVAARRSTL